jgi:DNA repair exonuclease SbcCD ATPase subunit
MPRSPGQPQAAGRANPPPASARSQGAAQGAPPASPPVVAPPAGSSPWRARAAAAARAQTLRVAITAAEGEGGSPELVEAWTVEADRLEKQAAETRPLLEQLTGCREFIGRAEKRREAKRAEIEALQKELDAVDKDIAEHKEKLEELEAQARPEPHLPDEAPLADVAGLLQEMQGIAERMKEAHAAEQDAKRRRKEAPAAQAAETAGETGQEAAASQPAPSSPASPATGPALGDLTAALQRLADRMQAWAADRPAAMSM